MNTPLCRQCRHFYITWDIKMPHGCRVYGFKTKDMPSSLVKISLGQDCSEFVSKKEARQGNGENQKGMDLNSDEYWK